MFSNTSIKTSFDSLKSYRLKRLILVIALNFILPMLFLTPATFAQVRVVNAETDNAHAIVRANIRNPKDYLRKASLDETGTTAAEEAGDDRDDSTDAEEPGPFVLKTNLSRTKDFEIERKKPGPPPPPGSFLPFDVRRFRGPDPMVAVGKNYVLVSDAHNIAFYNKQDGKWVMGWNASNLFSIFTRPTLPDGSPNENYVNNFYDVPADIPYYCSTDKGNIFNTTGGMINEAYDVRVIYQPDSQQYIIVAGLRNQTTVSQNPFNILSNGAHNDECRKVTVRLVAWFVISENLDTFYVYRTGENNVRDWPRVVVDRDYFILAHSGEGPDGSSIVTICSFPAMVAGQNKLVGFTIKRQDKNLTPNAVILVQNFFSNKGNHIFFVEKDDTLLAKPEHKAIRVWYLTKPVHRLDIFKDPPESLRLAGRLAYDQRRFNDPFSGVVFHKGKIWITTSEAAFPKLGDLAAASGINIFEIPVMDDGHGNLFVSQAVPWFKDEHYQDFRYSYEYPAIAVDAAGDLMVSFIRYPRYSPTEHSQIRSKVLFHNEAKARGSMLLKESAQPGNLKLQEADPKPHQFDYSWIARDPYDERYFWVAHSYLDGSNKRAMWVGKVDINDFK